jgi:CheY-like chemotaxis protein
MTSIANVLLADDDDDDCLLFKDVMKELSLPSKLSIASNGEQLMEMLTKQPLPDIIFLDLNMPLKSGFECLKEIRKNNQTRYLPVIIFSTSAQPSAVDNLYDEGATLYIKKPSSYSVLQERIQKIFSISWKDSPKLTKEDYFWP